MIKLTDEKRKEIINIYESSYFGNGYTNLKRYIEYESDSIELLYGILKNDELCAVHIVADGDFRIRNRKFSGYYLSYAAVLPQFRGAGYGRQLLKDTINMADEQGKVLLEMDPFQHSFYEGFGFSTAFDNYYLSIPQELIHTFKIRITNQLEGGFLNNSIKYMEEYILLKKYFFERSAYNDNYLNKIYWKSRMYDSFQFYYINDFDEKGYILYKIQDDNLSVYEMKYNNKKVFILLVSFITLYKNYVKTISFEAVPLDFYKEIMIKDFCNSGQKVCFEYYPIRMLRILNLEYIAKQLIKCHLINNEFSLYIEDKILERNNKVFVFNSDGVYAREKSEKSNGKIDIKDFTQLITGHMTAENLYYQNKLVLFDNDMYILKMLDGCFPPQITFSPDPM